MKYCVCSFIFNDYEVVREPLELSENCDYFLFTDNPNLTAQRWNVIYLDEYNTDEYIGIQKTLKFKYTFYKYIPNFEQYDYFVQLDGSLQVIKSLDNIIKYMQKFKYDMMVSPHPERDNFVDEYNAWIKGRNEDKKYLDIFLNSVGDYDLKTKGLIETTIKIYRNCKEILNFIDDVNMILETTCESCDKNDQCYFTYILSKHLDKLRIDYTDTPTYNNSKFYIARFIHGRYEYWDNGPRKESGKFMDFLGKKVKITPVTDYEKFTK